MSDLKMPDLNRVFLAGRLTRDPELKYTTNGKPYCKVRVANTRYYKDKNGERQEENTYADVMLWGPMAEFVGERLRKGRPVLIEGSLRTSEWEDASTGQQRSRLEINAQRLTPLDWDDSGGGRAAAPRSEATEQSGPREIEEPIP
ncbi:MAG TPA: single-stranded DNA-binding protein, partial [Candidatus Hydrogenedentes bacterium]|nr:single-stranded DNA-binding protein [Candidatus Hydrogenedentota bacterium]